MSAKLHGIGDSKGLCKTKLKGLCVIKLRKSAKFLGVAVIFTGATLAIPAVASAATATNSLGYTADFNAGINLQACKTVSNSRKLYGAGTRRDGSNAETVRNTVINSCTVVQGYTGTSKIYRIKACEDVALAPDPCSGWVNTGF